MRASPGRPAHWLSAAAGLGEHLRATLLLDGQWTISAARPLDGTRRLPGASGALAILEADPPLDLGLASIALDARFTSAGVGVRLDLVSRYATAAIGGQLGRDPAAGLMGVGPNSQLLLQGQVELAHARVLAQPVLADARFDGRVSGDLQAGGPPRAPGFFGPGGGAPPFFPYP